MYEIRSSVQHKPRVSRRALLRIGSMSLFGLSLPRVLAARAAQGAVGHDELSCILLWTEGGMSNIDTLDMKPQAPVEYRGEFTPIETCVSGVQVCEHLPHMARHMDKVCLVKSIVHPESGDHAAATHYMLTGFPQRSDPTGQAVGSVVYPAFGSVVARQQGWRESMPPNVQLGGGIHYSGAGYLGSAYNPLIVRADANAADFSVEDVSIPQAIGGERIARRRKMLARLDDWQRRAEQAKGAVADQGEFYRQAFDLITSPQAKRAFALDEEPQALRDAYGRTREGQASLLARRLVEAGVRFVTVSFGGWDTHDNNFGRLKGSLLPTLDKAWSSLLADLADRGLLDSTLVICAGEFGRTPRVNGAAGRDHYAPANVIGMSGAGVRMGTVVGQTDARCEHPVGQTNGTLDYAATVFKLLGIDGEREYVTDDGRPILVGGGGKAIDGVIG